MVGSPKALLAAIATVAAVILSGCTTGSDDSAYSVATFEVEGESYKIELATPELIEHVKQLMAGDEVAAIPNGVVVRDDPGPNAPWSWHIDPATLEFADFTTEVCDGLPSDVEDGLISGDRYCPWASVVTNLQLGRRVSLVH